MSHPQKHKLESERHQIFSLLSPCQKKKFLTTFEGNSYVDEYNIPYLKKTDQSILHIEERRCGKMGSGWSLGPGPLPSWAKTEDNTAAYISARTFINLKSKAVIHHYLNKHHTHFKVRRMFLLLLWWREQLCAGKSSPSTQRQTGSPPEHSIWVKATSDRRSFCFCCSSLWLLCQNITDALWFRIFGAKLCGRYRFSPPLSFQPLCSWASSLPILIYLLFLGLSTLSVNLVPTLFSLICLTTTP